MRVRRLLVVSVAAVFAMVWGSGSALAAPTWAVDDAPAPPGSVDSTLFSTDCVTAKTCFAVGVSDDGSARHGYVARLQSGEWIVEPTPTLPAARSQLRGIDCFNAKTCMAVGAYMQMAGGPDKAYSLLFTGRTWEAHPMPSPGVSDDGTQMYSVSCPSVNTCFAVGTARTSAGIDLVIQRWNGTAWSLQSFPAPVSTVAGLYDIDCTSSSACSAVGFYQDATTATSLPLVLRWNGTNWSQQTAERTGSIAGFFGVSCAAANACTAVGIYEDENSGDVMSLAQLWDGATWTARPVPAVAKGYLYDVSCPRANACLAAGTSYVPDADRAIAFRWNGESWASEQLPEVSGPEDRLFGVSCVSRAGCTAVGHAADTSNQWRALVMRSE